MTTAIFKNGGNKCHRSQVFVYLKLESPETYIGIPQLLLCMPYLLRYGDIEFGSHFEKWLSPRYAQFLKFPPSRILKPYVYITQINSQTSILPKCLRAYRAGPGLIRWVIFTSLLITKVSFIKIHSKPKFLIYVWRSRKTSRKSLGVFARKRVVSVFGSLGPF